MIQIAFFFHDIDWMGGEIQNKEEDVGVMCDYQHNTYLVKPVVPNLLCQTCCVKHVV